MGPSRVGKHHFGRLPIRWNRIHRRFVNFNACLADPVVRLRARADPVVMKILQPRGTGVGSKVTDRLGDYIQKCPNSERSELRSKIASRLPVPSLPRLASRVAATNPNATHAKSPAPWCLETLFGASRLTDEGCETPSGRVTIFGHSCSRVGEGVTAPLPSQTRACASNALGSSQGRFAQENSGAVVAGRTRSRGRGYLRSSSCIFAQFRRDLRLRRESHFLQIRVSW